MSRVFHTMSKEMTVREESHRKVAVLVICVPVASVIRAIVQKQASYCVCPSDKMYPGDGEEEEWVGVGRD